MRNINPVIPVPALIAAFSAMFLIMVIAWIRSRESRIKSTLALARRVAIAALAFVIALRPMKEEYGTDIRLSNLDVLFVLDTTLSMWADDGPETTRIRGAKTEIIDIMEALPGANFGLITFQNKSSVLAPFTQDTDALMRYLNSIKIPDKYYAKGSRMDVPYYDIENMLISSDRKENRYTVIFFLSDGEDTDPNPSPYSYEELGYMVDGGAVIGYGTEAGGEMMDANGYHVYSSESLERGVSRIDEDNLRKLADELGVKYFNCKKLSGLAPMLEEIMEESGIVTEKNRDYKFYGDTYYKYVPYLTGLLLLELLISIRQNIRTRRKHGKNKKQKTE
jgi:Ca-activated chloride channel family protein